MKRVIEIERKYAVGEDAVVPPLAGLPGVASVDDPEEQELASTYFDTADLALARARTTLRRRTGGDDAGWHLKQPVGGDERSEARLPLGRAVRSVPPALLGPVRVLVRDRPLAPVARIDTRRTVHRLRDAEGALLAELADDHVTATALMTGEPTGEAGEQRWREWEVELVDAGPALLEAAGRLLRDAGATPAPGPSKLARALGRPPVDDAPRERPVRPRSSAADVLTRHLAAQVAEVVGRDPGARTDEPDAVHKMRVATRRLRSALKTFRPLLDRGVTDPLRVELAWLAGVLGAARDTEVLRERLAALAQDGQPDARPGRLDAELEASHRDALAELVDALDSARYFRLLDALEALAAAPPWRDRARRPADAALPREVRHAYDRVRAGQQRAAAAPAEERDSLLHEVRKEAKALRYAGEAVAPALGRAAQRLAADAASLQEVLGEQQDSVVARERLRELAAGASGEQAFAYGRLHGIEEARSAQLHADYDAAWERLSAPRRRWLR